MLIGVISDSHDRMPAVRKALETFREAVVHSLHQVPAGGEADVEISGHTYKADVHEDEKGTLFVNPGESCGWLTGVCTAGLLRLPEKEFQQIVLMKDE